MGFGNGYGARSDRGSKRYNNAEVAHVWNSQNAEAGQSGNGNFYFEGRTLFSYGSHFVAGYIMPDGLALLNADSYSVSTSGHQSDAARAVSDRRTAHVADLTALAGYYKPVDRLARWIADNRPASDRARVRDAIKSALRDHATALTAEIYAPGAERYAYTYEPEFKSTRLPGERELGAYLADLAGLPAASWPKAKRDAERLAKAKAAAEAKADRVRGGARALQFADLSAKRWREWVAELASGYNAEMRLVEMRKELKRARSLMLAAKSGKLAAAGRLATIRDRIKRLDSVIATHAEHTARRERATSDARRLAIVRAWRDASPEAKAAATWNMLRDLASAAEWLAVAGRTAALKASAAELARLAQIGRDAIEAENARQRKLEAERALLKEEERRALWLAGERVGRIYFDAESGGAALRVVGDTLETSHGASVPLAHAVKAFRYIKLCRERGESFQRNGRTIRVGHYQVDSISESGDFRAGCHYFTWPEVERVARLAGVFDCAPSADAIEHTAHAA